MSRQKTKLIVTAGEREELVRITNKGSAREKKLARAILYFASGNWSYRATTKQLRMSKDALNHAVARFRVNRINGLIRPLGRRGRTSKMNDPAVREFLATQLATSSNTDAQVLAEEIHVQFGFRIQAASLPRWLRTWGLKLPRRPRRTETRHLSTAVEAYLNGELNRIGKILAKTEKDHPEWKQDIEFLRIQQDQILTFLKSTETGYTQNAIAEDLERSPSTISRWLKAFWGAGATVAAAQRILAVHET